MYRNHIDSHVKNLIKIIFYAINTFHFYYFVYYSSFPPKPDTRNLNHGEVKVSV
jgi:hypothetical protein